MAHVSNINTSSQNVLSILVTSNDRVTQSTPVASLTWLIKDAIKAQSQDVDMCNRKGCE